MGIFCSTTPPSHQSSAGLACALLATLVASSLLGGCGKGDVQSAGQRLDDTMADGKAAEAQVRQAATELGKAGADAAIVGRIKLLLTADGKLSASQIDVVAQDGVVTLTGTAPDAESVSRAASMAGAVRGVRSVVNRLVVRRS